MSADATYFNENHNGWGAFSPCEGCMDLNGCADSSLSASPLEFSLNGIDPDSGGGGGGGEAKIWEDEDIPQSSSRESLTDRWPYQILTAPVINLASYDCSAACAYLITIQYKLKTSSRRRSYLQCGFSDIFVVEKYAVDGSTETLMEHFCIGTSVPFIWNQSGIYDTWLQSDYADSDTSAENYIGRFRWVRSSAESNVWFNPYGLREDYDPEKDKLEKHCGTLSFFARGSDKIKVRLAQHTQVPWAINLNPRNDKIRGFSRGTKYASKADMSDKKDNTGNHKVTNYGDTQGNFKVRAFTRPVPGDLWDVTKKDGGLTVNNPEQKIKYFTKLYP